MSSATENQEVVVTLIDENEKPSSEEVKKTSKERRPRKNYCTEEYLVYYGIPILIVILVIVGIIFVLLYIRRYNRNCSHTKGVSCRGSLWYFN
jgi:predicted nucleic acid-binding Zn ribbon protein